jgi:hypothetical protein
MSSGIVVREFDLGAVYRGKGVELTGRLFYLRGVSAAQAAGASRMATQEMNRVRHERLKHLNPVMFSHYGQTRRSMEWDGDAWVGLYDGPKAVACYCVYTSHGSGWGTHGVRVFGEPRGGYDVRNEAVLAEYRGARVASQGLFPSIGDALRVMDKTRERDGDGARGGTAVVGVDKANGKVTLDTVDFLERVCGFTVVPPDGACCGEDEDVLLYRRYF